MTNMIPSTSLDKMFLGEETLLYHRLVVQFLLFIGVSLSIGILFWIWYVDDFLGLPSGISLLVKSIITLTVCNDFLNMLGHLLLRHRVLKQAPSSFDNAKLIVQYVSRGQNIEVLMESARNAYEVLRQECSIDFEVRLVTEIPVIHNFDLSEISKYNFICVPEGFKTRNGSLYKARALEYARITCDSVDNNRVWILYLDEESILTRSAVRGVQEFISEDTNLDTFSQGLITYTGRGTDVSSITSATEIKRVGYNLGRYYLQYAVLHDIYLGFQGSFFCASTRLVNQVTFDFGPEKSITEDLFFAFKAAACGFKCKWLEGYVREQAPESCIDLLRQRRRWMKGLMEFLFSNEIALGRRLILFLMITLPGRLWVWGVVPFLVVLNSLVSDSGINTFIQNHIIGSDYSGSYFSGLILPAFVFSVLLYFVLLLQSNFTIGLLYSVMDLDTTSRMERWKYVVRCCLVLPAAIFLEQFASIYAMFSRETGFAVIKKSVDTRKSLILSDSGSVDMNG
ncbi:MAG TPA: glycosyltransferase family 2 protein [Oligoflexia bacterium]|nr:glycosyltransferase family 2 protein [Oligoflexia bacterium]HMP49493.1 glycosyltransferase family 2 protein [Oligoflexia bacterium]